MSDYFSERDEMNYNKLNAVIDELPEFCEQFFLGIKQNTSLLTRLNYAYDLRVFFRFLCGNIKIFQDKTPQTLQIADLDALTTFHLEKYLDYLSFYEFDGKKYSCSERAKARKLSSVRALLRYFFNKEKLTSNIAAKIPTPKIHEKEIIRLEVDEIVKILNEAETGEHLSPSQKAFHNKTKTRDLAMLTLFLGTGIRISECVGLNIDDIDFSLNAFRVTRKGGNRVILYFSEEVSSVLKEYISERLETPGVPKEERALFLSLQKKRMSVRAVQDLVKKYAGLITPLKKITPHKLRSTYGTELYKETHDIYVVADVLGHKDVNTTKKHYAAISDEVRRSAANKVKLRD